MKTKLKKGQTVTLIVGADKGKTGEIIKLFPNDYCALVKGINVKKKHQKPSKEQKGGIINIEKPVHLSNLKVVEGKIDSKITKKVDTKKSNEKKIIENKIKEKKITKDTKKNKAKKSKKGKKGKKI